MADRLTGVYAVLVGPSICEEPIRWLFVDEIDADAFAAAIGDEAWVSWEPISESLDDPGLFDAFPCEIRAARRAMRARA